MLRHCGQEPTQVNAIETEIRTAKQHKLVTRVADLEEELFGKPRS